MRIIYTVSCSLTETPAKSFSIRIIAIAISDFSHIFNITSLIRQSLIHNNPYLQKII